MAAKVPVLDAKGKKVGDRNLAAGVFEAEISVGLMHQAVVAGAAAARSGTHKTKTRAEVSGGGRKPWRQKGTGRARHGSSRSPIWSGGGVAHGPQPREHDQRLNKKMRKAALRSALSDAFASGKVAVIDELAFDAPKTSAARALLAAMKLGGKILLVLPEPGQNVELSFRNLPDVHIAYAKSVAVWEIVAADRVLFTGTSLDIIEGEGRVKSPRDVIIRPVVSEKAYAGLEANRYTFLVAKDANKTEIKEAVQAIWNVRVLAVNTQNRRGKVKRRRFITGKRADSKRAIVTLSAGDEIEIFEAR